MGTPVFELRRPEHLLTLDSIKIAEATQVIFPPVLGPNAGQRVKSLLGLRILIQMRIRIDPIHRVVPVDVHAWEVRFPVVGRQEAARQRVVVAGDAFETRMLHAALHAEHGLARLRRGL